MVPPAAAARQALEAALTAWKDGKPPHALVEGSPVIHAIDSEWTNGRHLTAFEISGEKPSDADKRFTVKLELDKPVESINATYVVIGTAPISVFREEDYQRTMSMDNNPTNKPAKKRNRR